MAVNGLTQGANHLPIPTPKIYFQSINGFGSVSCKDLVLTTNWGCSLVNESQQKETSTLDIHVKSLARQKCLLAVTTSGLNVAQKISSSSEMCESSILCSIWSSRQQ